MSQSIYNPPVDNKCWQYRHRRRCEKTNNEGPLLINCIPSNDTIDVTIKGKGMVFKEITLPGMGDEIAHNGVEVALFYTGYLADGYIFGSTGHTGKPFKFVLGDDEARVVKGWHAGILGMKKDEIATLIIHPDLGYGPNGFEHLVPGNATLYFEIELVEWEAEDISVDGRGQIFRKRIKFGPDKHFVPNEGSIIRVVLEGSYNGIVFDKREISFALGEGEERHICRGVEQALYKFIDKEVSRLTILPSHAFGPSGDKIFGVPPQTTVTYTVQLKSITRSRELFDMDGQEKLQFSRDFKTKALNYFKQNKIRLAAVFYKRVTDCLKAEAMLTGDDELERKDLMYTSLLSQSLCYLKLGENQKALHSAEDGLKFNPNSEKAHFRKGSANLGLDNPVEAKADFEKVLSLVPTNKAAEHQLQISIRKIKENKEHDRIIYTRMFAAIGTTKNEKVGASGPTPTKC